ncbi:hypothetical protein [Flavobacterium haoranii]|uniref:Kazal-like domain-containing protein n=1 Tax=Flavobacterium haoranii TaxID=683124 RepID=A0A1M6LTB8_9FLAO|nr:hypothetical protein [Flavobacterium haoranii]SHJ74457.1 hypothetical protein SAMN05444337_2520 [Flavobacterium haoranii]
MKKNSIKRFYFLVIAPFLLLSSCLNEDALEKVSHEHKHRFNQEIVSFSKVNYLEPQINSFYQARNQNLRTSSTDSLNLDLNRVLVIEDSQSNYKSYSIVINNSIPENSTYFFENYHIIEEDDIILDSFIFRWTSDNPQDDFNLKTFSGTVQKFDINYNLITQSFYINGVLQQQNYNGNKNIASNNDTFEYYMACDVVTTCPCQGTGSGYCSCDPTSGSYTDSCGMTVGIVCYLTGGGSGDGGSGDSGSGLGGEGGGGGSSNNGQNDDNIGDNGDPLHPVVPLEPLEDTDFLEEVVTDPCDNLETKTSKKLNYMANFNNLNQPNKYTFPEESGFVEKKVNGMSQYQYIEGVNGKALNFPAGSLNFTHVHNNKPAVNSDGQNYDEAIKMFSPSDLSGLLGNCKRSCEMVGLSSTDAFGVLISNEGIFCISIIANITQTEIDFYNQKWNKFQNRYETKCVNLMVDFNTYTPNQRKEILQKMFLKELEKLQLNDKIGFFEGEVLIENGIEKLKWKRKTLNNSGSLVETPC